MDAGENTINSNEKQDVMIYIRFVRGHWKIYIVAVLLTVVVSMIYGLFFKEKAYESTAGLYYPAAISELVESVSDRDFMDDAEVEMEKHIVYRAYFAGSAWNQSVSVKV